jgi:chemotaxis family two-component system sensor kinase Cph1
MTYDIRMTCRALAGTLAVQIKSKEEGESYRQRLRLRNVEDEVVRLIFREGSLDLTLASHLDELIRMLNADGVAVLRQSDLVVGGVCPGGNEIRALAKWVLERKTEELFSTDRLPEVYPPAAEFQARGSGLLSLTLSADEPWLLLWFRAEYVEVVNWAGNPHKSKSMDPSGMLGPRASFEAWRETVRGRARRWTLPETEAVLRLKNAMLDVRQTRHVLDLNQRLTDVVRHKDLLLQQKEFLIGEVNHRVQNSLQLVSGFLSMQARASDSSAAKADLTEAQRRLSAVSLVHRRLYRGEQVQVIDAAQYMEELCADTISSMGQEWAQCLSLDLAPVIVSTDQAIPIGLVLTELIININKFAYPDGSDPFKSASQNRLEPLN